MSRPFSILFYPFLAPGLHDGDRIFPLPLNGGGEGMIGMALMPHAIAATNANGSQS